MSALPHDELARLRDFYRRQLEESFRYSRRFSQPHGVLAEQIADTPEFEAILADCSPGSLECARRLGEMAVVRLDRVPTPGAWWRDLLNYERGCFLQTATTVEGPPTNRPRRGVCALSMRFSWAMPELVRRLETSEPIGDALRRPVILLFARSAQGKVNVAEIGAAVERVFRSTNGLRTVEQIASAASLDPAETSRILDALADTGAVVRAMSPEEMSRMIEQRQK